MDYIHEKIIGTLFLILILTPFIVYADSPIEKWGIRFFGSLNKFAKVYIVTWGIILSLTLLHWIWTI